MLKFVSDINPWSVTPPPRPPFLQCYCRPFSVILQTLLKGLLKAMPRLPRYGLLLRELYAETLSTLVEKEENGSWDRFSVQRTVTLYSQITQNDFK